MKNTPFFYIKKERYQSFKIYQIYILLFIEYKKI